MGQPGQRVPAGRVPPAVLEHPLIGPAQAEMGIVGDLQGPAQLWTHLHLVSRLRVEGGEALRIGVTGSRGALGDQDRPHVDHWQARGLGHCFMALPLADQAPDDRSLVAPGVGPADATAVAVIPQPLHTRPVDKRDGQRGEPVRGPGCWVDQVGVIPPAGLEQANTGHWIELVVAHAGSCCKPVRPAGCQSQVRGAEILRPWCRRREPFPPISGAALWRGRRQLVNRWSRGIRCSLGRRGRLSGWLGGFPASGLPAAAGCGCGHRPIMPC